MKKLLAVLLILSVASVASATMITFAPQDPITLVKSDVIAIDIISDGGLISADLVVKVTGPGTIVDVAAQGWDPALSFAPDFRGEGDGSSVALGYGTFATSPAVVATIWFHCDGEGLVLLDLMPGQNFGGSWDAGFNAAEIAGTLEIIQVPEPMTMSLLGLGGLALIRRRRA
jgi:hypothetical protein